MSLAFRIIPRLDIKGPNLVKGINLEGLRVIGKPETFAKYYYENGADELIYQDVVASLYGRNSLEDIIQKTAKNNFIPLTVGGGIKKLNDVNIILRCGADKISINTSAVECPKFISQISNVYGKSTVVVSIEAIKQKTGEYEAFTDNGRNRTGKDVINWAQQAEEMGAGEILLTSVDKEGTGEGVDIELIRKVREKIKIPLVVHGGIGKVEDIIYLKKNIDIEGINLASILHYNLLNLNNESDIIGEGNIEYLKNRNMKLKNIKPIDIKNLKKILKNNQIDCRINE